MEKPDEEECLDASYVCWDLAKFIEETEPYATREINSLREAANSLAAFADYEGESDEETE